MTKINQFVLVWGVLLLVSIAATGCAANVAGGGENKASAKKTAVAKLQQAAKQQKVVVVNKPRQTAGSAASNGVKDQHHIAYERKRMLYNQKWLARQEAEALQKAQRRKYQQKYEQKLREQELALQQAKQQRAQQARQQRLQQAQQQLVLANARHQGHSKQDIYLQRQAQIEARQQQHNWQRSANWRQVAARQKLLQQQAAHRQNQARSIVQAHNPNLAEHLSNAAIARTYHKVRYDGRYIPISYPMGDIPANMGVCTDTLIRSYRRLGIDLQRLVHEDISRAFHLYPNLPKWGLSAPDPNIDHRRVHNLKVFFGRHGQRLPVTNNPEDYRPGDIVTWHLGGDQEHIGLVVNRRSPQDPRRYMIVHNIAKGDRMEDILFTMPITGHYRYLPNRSSRWLASR